VTENKHSSEESVDETEAGAEADIPSDETALDDFGPEDPEDTATDTPGKHAAQEDTETVEDTDEVSEPAEPKRQRSWARVVAFGVLPTLAFLLAVGAAYLKFVDSAVRESNIARDESVQAAKDSTVALLTYNPDTVEQQLTAARDRLTGDFLGQYTDLTNNVVIPGARQKQIAAVASVPAAASVSADPGHAVVLVFVNQTVTVGSGAPADTASSVRITLDKVGGRWLISQFDPV
jgi:Mce-associated membrane protein